MRAPVLLLLVLMACGGVQGQAAAQRIPVRVGEHPGHGRLVFDFPTAPRYTVSQRGDVHHVAFPPGGSFAVDAVRRLPRNVTALRVVDGGVDIVLVPGARLRHFRNGPKVAFDALDPAPGAAGREAPPSRPATIQAPPSSRPPPEAAPLREASPQQAPLPTPQLVPPAAVPPAAAQAPTPALPEVAQPPPPPVAADLPLPFPPNTGAAMLRRGESWLIALDAAPEAPLSATPRPGMAYRAIPGGALLTLDDAGPMRLRHVAGRWFLTSQPRAAEPEAIAGLTEAPGVLGFAAADAQRVLSIQDPETGLPMLLGTLRQGQARVAVPRAMVDLQLLETTLGVAVIARSDAVVMRANGARFVISAEGGDRLALGGGSVPRAVMAMPPGSRSFDLPQGSPVELAQRLRSQQLGLAQAAPLARGMMRLAAAETLLAMGQPQEAQAMVQLAQQEDPTVAALPRAAWLGGAAALAAGRLEEATALEAEPISVETAMWRGLLQAMRGEAPAAAAAIIAGRDILRGYPDAVQRRLLPRVAESLANARQIVAAQAILEGDGVLGIELARAILAEQQGDAAAALAGYTTITSSRDRRMRAEAMRRGTELRLQTGQIDALAASRGLEQTLFAWRDEGDEFATRQRIAALRQQGGDPAGALALLRESAALYPERQAALQPAIQASFMAALAQQTPLNAVALHDAHPELMPSGPEGVAALSLLADRLASLDLADRAVALLRQAVERAPPGQPRAAAGARLAALQLAERDIPGALASLAASDADNLPPGLQRERALLAARAQTGEGAAIALAALGPAGDEALAEILADRRDFAGAAAALGRHLDRQLAGQANPVAPELVRGLVRQAALLALAGDTAALAQLRAARGTLLSGGPGEAPFQLLTTDPVRGLADLPRLQNELELFRVLPARLDRLRTASVSAR